MTVGSSEALYIRIDRELQGHVPSDPLSCCIFKVPNHLRKVKEKAYEPQVISIGPYHRGKDHLKAMEVHKKHYLKMLLDRNKEKTLKEYVEALEGLKEKALKFYSEPPYQRDGEDQFVEMMLFDGCFVVEFIRKIVEPGFREKKDHLLADFILITIVRDMLLIENQLPFFILIELFDKSKMPNEADQNFMHMAIDYLNRVMPEGFGNCNGKINDPAGKHLLGLLHDCCVSADYGGSSKEDEGISAEEDRGSFVRYSPLKRFKLFLLAIMEGDKEKNYNRRNIGSASELHEAGIKFEKSKGRIFDMKFEKGVMSIPTLKIDDHTESTLRNLVAYEQCYKDITSRHFTDYIRFMDYLINTGKDVELLCHSEVIENMLGDNAVVAEIFNRISDNVLIDEENFYAKKFRDVNKHCKKNWNRWIANLKHNYFNTPWAWISFVAAVFLLLLTVMQTVYSALGYHQQ
ncbi:hypothetical protein SLA2020_506460 [Shorea laevis]